MTRKRFIAGAVCPSCGQMDTLQLYTSRSGEQVRECVECDFLEQMTASPVLKGELPETRISREEKALDENVEVVRFVSS